MSQRPHSPTLSDMECESPVNSSSPVQLTADKATSPLTPISDTRIDSSIPAPKHELVDSSIKASVPAPDEAAQDKPAEAKPTTLTLTINANPAGNNAQAAPKAGTSRKLARYLTDDKSEAFIAPIYDDLEETLNQAKRECPSIAHVANADLAIRLRFDGPHPPAVQNTLFRVSQASWPNAITDVLPLVHIGLKKASAALPPANDAKASSGATCKEELDSNKQCCKASNVEDTGRKAKKNDEKKDHPPARRLQPNALFEVHMQLMKDIAQGHIEYLKMCEVTRRLKEVSKDTDSQEAPQVPAKSTSQKALLTGDDGLGNLERAIKDVQNRAEQVDEQRRAEQVVLGIGEMTWNDLCREGSLLGV